MNLFQNLKHCSKNKLDTFMHKQRNRRLLAGMIIVSFFVYIAGCGGSPSQQEMKEKAPKLGFSVNSGFNNITSMLAPLSQLPDLTKANAVSLVEGAFSSNAHVNSSSCVSFKWIELSVTIIFNDCVLNNGSLVAGSINIGIALDPTGFAVTFHQLSIDNMLVDGLVGMTIDVNAQTTSSIADILLSADGGRAQLQFNNLIMDTSPQKVVFNGGGTFIDPSQSLAIETVQVTILKGDCLPSSGSLSYSQAGVKATIIFLLTTPQTGEVQLKLGSLPPITYRLFTPCGK